jgi:hypothetical protein
MLLENKRAKRAKRKEKGTRLSTSSVEVQDLHVLLMDVPRSRFVKAAASRAAATFTIDPRFAMRSTLLLVRAPSYQPWLRRRHRRQRHLASSTLASAWNGVAYEIRRPGVACNQRITIRSPSVAVKPLIRRRYFRLASLTSPGVAGLALRLQRCRRRHGTDTPTGVADRRCLQLSPLAHAINAVILTASAASGDLAVGVNGPSSADSIMAS